MTGNPDRTAGYDQLLDRLRRRLDASAPYALSTVTAAFLVEAVAAADVAIFLADYGGTTLERLAGETVAATAAVESLVIVDHRAGRAHVEQRVVVATNRTDAGWQVWAPITVRSERLGVLEATLPEYPDENLVSLLGDAAVVVGSALVTARPFTDLFHRVRRRRELGVAAELQWELLPAVEFAAADFELAGALEPAYDMAGDSFDYAIDPNRLSVVITDGMGHGLSAALLATVAVTALRNARRWGYDLAVQATRAAHSVFDQFGGDAYVTAILLEINRATGQVAAVNAGHPPPLRVRDGVVAELPLAPDYPLGLWPEREYQVQHFHLEPGDRLVLISDGVTETASVSGEEYGASRLADLLGGELRAGTASSVVRAVTRSVVAHRGDTLRDDTTLVCIDWRGPPTKAGSQTHPRQQSTLATPPKV